MRRSLFFSLLVFGSLVLSGCDGRGMQMIFDNTPTAPAPTEEEVAFVTPTTAAAAPIATPTPVVIVVTATPPPVVPPTETPDKKVGGPGRSTPPPAVDSPPPPTPTPTIPGLWLFDDFENPDNDGDFDRGLWTYYSDQASSTTIEQNNGFLTISREAPNGGGLNYEPLKIEQIGFAEAKVMLDGNVEASVGDVSIYLSSNDWELVCGIDAVASWASCWVKGFESGVKVTHNSWYTMRFEVNSDTSTISFFVDDAQIGTYLPPDPKAFKQAQVTFGVRVWSQDGGLVTGYFDDVRVEKAQAGVVDPALYDDFNDEQYEGTFDPEKWEKWADGSPQAQIGQQNGEMVFTLTQPTPNDVAGLQPEAWALGQFQFIEAKLRLGSESETSSGGDGTIGLDLGAPLENDRDLGLHCFITREGAVKVKCSADVRNKTNQTSEEYAEFGVTPTGFDIWHTVRIEVDPQVNATFYIDGVQVGSYTPTAAEQVKNFYPGIWVWSATQDSIKGYADDVRIGRSGQP